MSRHDTTIIILVIIMITMITGPTPPFFKPANAPQDAGVVCSFGAAHAMQEPRTRQGGQARGARLGNVLRRVL
jgi:hypothetical protein